MLSSNGVHTLTACLIAADADAEQQEWGQPPTLLLIHDWLLTPATPAGRRGMRSVEFPLHPDDLLTDSAGLPALLHRVAKDVENPSQPTPYQSTLDTIISRVRATAPDARLVAWAACYHDIHRTTMLRRQLGRKLESLRKAAGLTMEKAAEELDRARATLYRIESGAENVRFRSADVKEMLKIYGASDEDTGLVLAMASATRENKNWWHDYIGSGLPRWFQLYIGLEAAASSIRQYQAELVPGLLQTRAYAEQLFRMPGGAIEAEDRDGQERAIQLRVERQALLTRFSAPQLNRPSRPAGRSPGSA